MRWVPLAVLLVTASAQAQDAGVEPYWQARRAGAVGVVAGRVFIRIRWLQSGSPVVARHGRLKLQNSRKMREFTFG